jgi:hypothetical protein
MRILTNKYEIGEKVMITNRNGGLAQESTVASISPKGNVITLANGKKFTAEGTEQGSSRYHSYYYMSPFDAEYAQRLKDQDERRSLAYSLRETNFANFSLATLRQLAAIVAEELADKNAAAQVVSE